MRFHTDTLTYNDIIDALTQEQERGRIAGDVKFKELKLHSSRDRARAFEIQLEALTKEPGDGRRSGNSGSYGAMVGNGYAATYDEWGWLLANLYARDAYMRVGAKGSPIYRDDDDFHDKTGLSYAPNALRSNLTYPTPEQGSDPYPFTISRLSGTAGNMGRGRSDGDQMSRSTYNEAIENPGKLIYGCIRYQPRTLADVPA